MNEMLFEYLKVVKVLVGYKHCETLDLMLKGILNFMIGLYNLSDVEINTLEGKVCKLFSIETYSDYKMIAKASNDEIYKNSDIYFEYLLKKNNISKNFNKEEFKELVNESSCEGDIDYLRIKSILLFLGIIYEKQEKAAIDLLKIIAYCGDIISFKLLTLMDIENKKLYDELYDLLNDLYNGYILDIESLSCNEEIKKQCQWIMNNRSKINSVNDKKTLRYLFLNNDSFVKEITDKVNGKVKKSKLGF